MQPVATVGPDGTPERSAVQAQWAAGEAEKRPAKAVVQTAEGAAPQVVGRREHRPGPESHRGPRARAAIRHGYCNIPLVPHD